MALPHTEHQLIVIEIDGNDAWESWQTLRAAVPETGRYPIVAGGPDSLRGNDGGVESLLEPVTWLEEFSPAAIIEASLAVDVEALETQRLVSGGINDVIPDSGITVTHFDRPPPAPDAENWMSVTLDFTTFEPAPSIDVILLPTPHSWEVAAYLSWGGWNANPPPEEQVALHRHWAERYDAEVAGMAIDTLEMNVGSPPSADDDVVELALQHAAYAPDNIFQGSGDLDVYASSVRESTWWYFWWD